MMRHILADIIYCTQTDVITYMYKIVEQWFVQLSFQRCTFEPVKATKQ